MAFSLAEIAVVKGLLVQGHTQQDIAHYYGTSIGRINEVKSGKNKLAIGVEPATTGLPTLGPAAREVRDIQMVALEESAAHLAVFVAELRRAKSPDHDEINEVKRTLAKVHVAMANRAQETGRTKRAQP
jgi:hypothetical protein